MYKKSLALKLLFYTQILMQKFLRKSKIMEKDLRRDINANMADGLKIYV